MRSKEKKTEPKDVAEGIAIRSGARPKAVRKKGAPVKKRS